MKRLSYRKRAEKEAASAAALAAYFSPEEELVTKNLAGIGEILSNQKIRADSAWEAFANASQAEVAHLQEVAHKEETHLQNLRKQVEEELSPGGSSWPSKRRRRALQLEAGRRGFTLARLESEEEKLNALIFDVRRRR